MGLPSAWTANIQKLPVLPQVAMKITERMQSPTATVQEIAGLIKTDIGLTTKILRLANSSYYSVPGGVNDVTKALQYLGFTTIAQIVLTTSVFGVFKATGVREFPLTQFWLHSFAVGLLCEITARSMQLKTAPDAFVSGLMHDMGKLILLEMAPDQLVKIVKHAEDKHISFHQSETELGLPSHQQLGIELGRHWRLPAAVIEAIQYHHGDGTKTEHKIIEWADVYAHTQKIGFSGSYEVPEPEVEGTMAATFGLSDKARKQIETLFQKEFEKAGAILSGS
ncbi:MAG: HDOD domain-containing protein [Bdellovibrionales bacterium]|nr:HDOD domain-containing protein [Bdellovibrionales bacterium]